MQRHNLSFTRKGLRKHLAEEHARNEFRRSEIDAKGKGIWERK